jgi:hypothetical protein
VAAVDRDAVADHHKADRLVAGVQPAVPGLRVRIVLGILQGLGDVGDEEVLLVGDRERFDGRAVVLGDLTQRHHRRLPMSTCVSHCVLPQFGQLQ